MWHRGNTSTGAGTCSSSCNPGFVACAAGCCASPPKPRIEAAHRETCLSTGTGAAKCWGPNALGQLGGGVTTPSSSAVAVTVLGADFIRTISPGDLHACALTSSFAVECWGGNAMGQLGHNSTVDRVNAVVVSGLSSDVASIVAGFNHTCAVLSGGAAKCWGGNANGQLGAGLGTDSSYPVPVMGLEAGVAAIAAKSNHTCALTTAGAVKCWGLNDHGQLGNDSTAPASAPVAVSGLGAGVVAIATGTSHSCAVMASGAVKCWGANPFGQLGNNSTVDSHVPVDAASLGSNVTAVAAGYASTCALTAAGAVKCWGSNGYGQLGIGFMTPNSSLVPVDVLSMDAGVMGIAVGSLHACGLMGDKRVKCWGDNANNELGRPTNTSSDATPGEVTGL